ncbi:MAG: hypothetical protein HOP30_13675 [Cyclobacteriaceae bacterium]|nr:hypothetical protein [Cyclobacteriaceae bacterium]
MKIVYWILFCLSLAALILNFGLGLIGFGIFIFPMLILHISNGLRLSKLNDHKVAVILSVVNLFAFALLRPDGVHAMTGNGLSALLDLVGIDGGYNSADVNLYFGAACVLFFIQLVMDIRIRIIIHRVS